MASENQASPSKPRSMLPRTLVVILSPISDVPTTNLRRFSSKKFEKVFEDFKQCNKQSISVQLQDAVDDIQFVGCLSPFTLLIHGSTEDMDTIEHAWVGRMLKPPSGFLIKDFGEISEVKMKQILQSQFISISDTLCEIVKGLNECQIASTFECVLSRLCSSFDSVVIPPMTAIKKSLDLLVEDKRLTFINGLYNYVVPLKLTKESPTVKHQAPEIRTPGLQKSTYSTKKAATEGKRYVRREHSPKEHNLRSQNEKEKERALKTKKLKYSCGKFTEKTRREARLDNNLSFSRKVTRNGRRNEIVKSNSLKIRRPNHCIPRRQYSYEVLPSHAAQDEIESKKANKKRNSFIGKLSRLFRIEDGKLTSNDETEDDDYDICDKEWDKIVSNEQTKLLSSKTETKQQNALIKEKKNGVKTKRKKERGVSSNKQLDRKKYSESSAKVSRDKNKNEGERRLEGYSRKYSSRSSKTSTNASPRSRSPDWLNANFSRDSKSTVAVRQNTKWKTSQKKEHEMKRTNEKQLSSRKDSFSSFSDSNYSFESDLDYSSSSDSSVDIKRKSFHYSDDDTTDEESQLGSWEDGSKFSSTRAICGDLEINNLSLNPSNGTPSSSDSTKVTKPVENHSTTTTLYGNKASDQNICQQNKLHGRNLVQFIGIL